jgi:single-strand selective monofunctional uracil DNA glycosylase
MTARRGTSLSRVAARLADEVDRMTFGHPVTCVYNPLRYAWRPHRTYLERYGSLGASVLLVGMNPGPFGMAQTGVPFGDPVLVRDWLGVDGPVGRPALEHPRRQVLGFDSPRREVSGQRLWGWACERFGRPERFFEQYFVANYCPLCFLEETGRNRTPDKLPVGERDLLQAACDAALRATVDALEPEAVIGIGKFAERRIRLALPDPGGLVIGSMLHPSPASPLANRGWAARAEADLWRLLGRPIVKKRA